MNKWLYILLNSLTVLFMIALIPLVKSDLILTLVYVVFITASLLIYRKPKDILVYGFGFALMTFSEYVFVSTGVETFLRNSFLGIMPLWLPVLWGYCFVIIKRSIAVL